MEILRYTPAKQEGAYQGSLNMRMKIRYLVPQLNDKGEKIGEIWVDDVQTINKIKIYKNKFGKKFISFPTETYEQDGQKKYFPLNHMDGKEKFEYALLRNLGVYLENTQAKTITQDAQQEDVPF